MSRILISLFLAISFSIKASAQAGILAPGLGAAVGAILTKNKDIGTQIAATAGGAIVGNFVGNYLENNSARAKFKAYQLGRYQEAWIRQELDWYYSTLDRKSGLPTAYDGNWAMFLGLPEQEREILRQKATLPVQYVPADRDAYLNYLMAATQQKPETAGANQDLPLVEIPKSEATMPQRTVNGIKMRPVKRQFPKLP